MTDTNWFNSQHVTTLASIQLIANHLTD